MTSKVLLGHIGNLQEQLAQARSGTAAGESSEMVERVARALAKAHMVHAGSGAPLYGELARTVIAAEREPTEAMLEAGGAMFLGSSHSAGAQAAKAIWQAMVDAALGK